MGPWFPPGSAAQAHRQSAASLPAGLPARFRAVCRSLLSGRSLFVERTTRMSVGLKVCRTPAGGLRIGWVRRWHWRNPRSHYTRRAEDVHCLGRRYRLSSYWLCRRDKRKRWAIAGHLLQEKPSEGTNGVRRGPRGSRPSPEERSHPSPGGCRCSARR